MPDLKDPIVIVAARRTPIGDFLGGLGPAPAPQLSAAATRACLEDCGLDPAGIDEVLLGCVLPAGIGQAPARQAALAAGVPEQVPCTTVNKVCGSGMKTLMLGHDAIVADHARVVLCGGMESMSNAPYLLTRARTGYRMGHAEMLDHMFFDGLQNPYDGNMMGYFAEETAAKYGFTREQQDAFAIASVERARAAIENGAFAAEVTPVRVRSRKAEVEIAQDEGPMRQDVAKIPQLKPAFRENGTVTAASSSSISDGAASLVIMRQSEAERRGLPVLARIVGQAGAAQEPAWFTTAPVRAMRVLLERTGWSVDAVDLFEVNEAFACVAMAAMHDLGIEHAKLNVNGGACALGHPIGASGARIVVTLVHALRARGGGRGVASLCIGGGEATAVAVEV
jgi:acetyl-CoA C-acetyltransferase